MSARFFFMLFSWCALLVGSRVSSQVIVPDFTLAELNASSARAAVTSRLVSPRDYAQQVVIYYFGAET